MLERSLVLLQRGVRAVEDQTSLQWTALKKHEVRPVEAIRTTTVDTCRNGIAGDATLWALKGKVRVPRVSATSPSATHLPASVHLPSSFALAQDRDGWRTPAFLLRSRTNSGSPLTASES